MTTIQELANQPEPHPYAQEQQHSRGAWRAATTLVRSGGKDVSEGGDGALYGDLDIEGHTSAISDLIADLMHLCDALDLDFDAQVIGARYHYEPEKEGVL